MRKVLFLTLFVSLFAWGFHVSPLTAQDADCNGTNGTGIILNDFASTVPMSGCFGRVGSSNTTWAMGVVYSGAMVDEAVLSVAPAATCPGGQWQWSCWDLDAEEADDAFASVGVTDGPFTAYVVPGDPTSGIVPDVDGPNYALPEFDAGYHFCQAECYTNDEAYAWGILVVD